MSIDKKILYKAKFCIGEVVKHRFFDFRGVIFDVDPEFDNTEEWWDSIPAEIRPRKNQPFYHLFAVQEGMQYTAYVSEQNLVGDDSLIPIEHASVEDFFDGVSEGLYKQRHILFN